MDKTPDNPLVNLTVSRTVRNEANISVILQQVHPMQRRDEPEERGLSPRTASRRLRRTGSGRSSPASLSRILRAVLFRPIRGAAPCVPSVPLRAVWRLQAPHLTTVSRAKPWLSNLPHLNDLVDAPSSGNTGRLRACLERQKNPRSGKPAGDGCAWAIGSR